MALLNRSVTVEPPLGGKGVVGGYAGGVYGKRGVIVVKVPTES